MFLKFRKLQPGYSYKIYSYKKKECSANSLVAVLFCICVYAQAPFAYGGNGGGGFSAAHSEA